jgi:hypothetical protein
MIKIKSKTKQNCEFAVAKDVEVINSKGDVIRNVASVDIEIRPDDVVRALVSLHIGDIELDCHERFIYVDDDGNRYRKLIDGESE